MGLRIVKPHKYHISQVCFAEIDQPFGKLIWYEPSGNERIIFLQKVLDGEELPDGIRLATNAHGGLTAIMKDDINWDTCTLRPGGKGRYIW